MSQENVEIVRGVRYPVSLPKERASQRRSLDERLFLRFPTLYRLFADRLLRLPQRSRLRRLLLTRIAGRAAAAGNRRDFDVLLYAFDPAIEFELPESQAGGYLPPDLPAIHHGRDGYRRMSVREWGGTPGSQGTLKPLLGQPALGAQLHLASIYRGREPRMSCRARADRAKTRTRPKRRGRESAPDRQ